MSGLQKDHIVKLWQLAKWNLTTSPHELAEFVLERERVLRTSYQNGIVQLCVEALSNQKSGYTTEDHAGCMAEMLILARQLGRMPVPQPNAQWQVLQHAAKLKTPHFLLALHWAGFDLSIVSPKDGSTVLHSYLKIASAKDVATLLHELPLLQARQLLEHKDNRGLLPIEWAAPNRHAGLLAALADISAQALPQDEGYTLAVAAVEQGNVALVFELILRKPDIFRALPPIYQAGVAALEGAQHQQPPLAIRHDIARAAHLAAWAHDAKNRLYPEHNDTLDELRLALRQERLKSPVTAMNMTAPRNSGRYH